MMSIHLKLFGWFVFCLTLLLFAGCESDGSSSQYNHHYYAGYGGMWYYDDDYPDYIVVPPGSAVPPNQGADGPHPEHPIAKPHPDRPETLPAQRPHDSISSRPSIPSRSRGGGGRRR